MFFSNSSDVNVITTSSGPGSVLDHNLKTILLYFSIGMVSCFSDTVKFKEREERQRLARERREEEQKRKLQELLETQRKAQEYREQHEKERKQKLIEMRKREEDPRLAMLERKKRMDQEEQVSFGFIQLLRHFWVI